MSQTPATQVKSIANYMSSPTISKFLDETLSSKKGEFVSNMIALVDSDKNLAECDFGLLIKCAMNATALNLPLNKNLGYAYVIPYKGIPSFQIGYKGIIQLAIRTGQYKYINAVEIRQGEIERNKITGAITFIKENPSEKVVGYIAYLELMSGFSASLYMTEEQIEAHAIRYSKTYANDLKYKSMSSKWSDPVDRPKMALKTVLKGLLGTYGLLSSEIIKAFEADNDEDDAKGERFTDAEVITQTDPQPTTSQPTSSGPKQVQI